MPVKLTYSLLLLLTIGLVTSSALVRHAYEDNVSNIIATIAGDNLSV
jgi:hypothetical protein